MILKYLTRSFIMITLLGFPVISWAALVTCGVGDGPACTFPDIFILLNTIMEFLVVTVAVPLAVITIVYGGIIITIYASNSGKREEGKKIIWTAIKGFVLVLAAFILVKFIVFSLTGDVGLLDNVFGNE